VERFLVDVFGEVTKDERNHSAANGNANQGTTTADDAALIERARKSQNGSRFTALYDRGDRKGAGYSSQSEADLALCSMLAFWFKGDRAAIDRAFRSSALYRDKWDREDYRDRTIDEALNGRTEFYDGGRHEHDEGREHKEETDSVTEEQQTDDDWPDLVSLAAPAPPEIPIEAFPPAIRDMISAVLAETETPLELAAGMAIAALAAACQGRFIVHVINHLEALVIWAVVVLHSGERKTPVHRAMTAPLVQWEAEQIEAMRPEIGRAASELETLKAQIGAQRSKAARLPPGSPEFIAAKREIAEAEANLPEVPTSPRIWTEDATPEALGRLMAQNNERIALISDEGGIFATVNGRYSSGIPNPDLFLKGHIGSPVRVTRSTRDEVTMTSPALSMALTIQPEILHDVMSNRLFRGSGFLARITYFMGSSRVGYRNGNGPPVPEDVRRAYGACIRRLLAIRPPDDKPLTIELSEEARESWREFSLAVERDMRDGGRLEHIRDWGAKLAGMAARLAGLLHCAEHGSPAAIPLTAETMDKAITLAQVCMVHALLAFDAMELDPDLSAARKLWNWIERQRRPQITFKEAFNALRGRQEFSRAKNLEEPFAILVERNYLRALEQKKKVRPYLVNPNVARRNADA
jgi:hypothetical protein